MTTEADTPLTTTIPNEHEDPSFSSASLCIQFHILGETFGPVFTHQAFPGEWIRGYHPPTKKLMELTEEDPSKLLHSSHIHHEAASKELSIDVKLSPSCEACQVKICTEQKRLPRRQSVRASKRRRVEVSPSSEEQEEEEKEEFLDYNENSEKEEEEMASDNESASEPEYNDEEDEKDDDSEFEVDGNISEVEEEEEKEGTTRKSRKPTKEILQSMKKGLPPVTENKFVDDHFLRRPLGVELKEYSVNGKDFVLCLASGEEAAKFHNEVQRLALWLIETADDVDVASTEGGFWKVLYLLQKHKRTQYSLAGYTTLFHFYAPFKKPKAGYVVRICQALVLPPFQRSGHGKQMLTCVLDMAHGQYSEQLTAATRGEKDDDEIVELNVECPAPAFIMLRNRTDYDCLLRSMDSEDPWFCNDGSVAVTDESFFTSVGESELVQAAAKAKIIPRQIQIVQELFKLQKLHDHLESSGHEDKEELEKRFRLMVKKRLNKENREHLSGFRTKAEKQAFLEEEFSKCLESYKTTLRLHDAGDR